jgi:hypothetical protein
MYHAQALSALVRPKAESASREALQNDVEIDERPLNRAGDAIQPVPTVNSELPNEV